jgi:hypothetical protein
VKEYLPSTRVTLPLGWIWPYSSMTTYAVLLAFTPEAPGQTASEFCLRQCGMKLTLSIAVCLKL